MRFGDEIRLDLLRRRAENAANAAAERPLGLGGIDLPGEDKYYSGQIASQSRRLSGGLTADRQLALNDLERRGIGQGSAAIGTYGRFTQALGQGIADINQNVSGQQFLSRERRIASALDYLRQRQLLALQASIAKKAKQKTPLEIIGGLTGAVGQFIGAAQGAPDERTVTQ